MSSPNPNVLHAVCPRDIFPRRSFGAQRTTRIFRPYVDHVRCVRATYAWPTCWMLTYSRAGVLARNVQQEFFVPTSIMCGAYAPRMRDLRVECWECELNENKFYFDGKHTRIYQFMLKFFQYSQHISLRYAQAYVPRDNLWWFLDVRHTYDTYVARTTHLLHAHYMHTWQVRVSMSTCVVCGAQVAPTPNLQHTYYTPT